MEELEEGLEDHDFNTPTTTVPELDDVAEIPLPNDGKFSASVWCARNQRPVLLLGLVILFLSVLFGSGLALVYFGNTTQEPLPFPIWESYRLPLTIKPYSYVLNLTIDVAKGTVRGSETVRINVRDKTSFVVMHASEDIKIVKALLGVTPDPTRSPSRAGDSSSIDGSNQHWVDGARISVDDVSAADHIIYEPRYQHYKLQWRALLDFTTPTNSNKRLEQDFVLGIEWVGKLSDDMRGIYRSKYHDGAREVVLVSTQFESTDARAMFPCFDEPGMKAYFGLTVNSHKSRGTVLSNMPVEKQETVGDMLRTTFKLSPRMSTYLVALVVSEFKAVKAAAHPSYPVSVYARPEVASQGQFAADTGAAILDAFSAYFELPYQLPKLDMAAIPDFNAGAMENWGLLTYRETALLWDALNSGTRSQQYVAMVVSHELAHQWFGDTVTMAWWEDIWLNEGFASFVEYVGVDKVRPEWRIWEHFVVDDQQRALEADSLASTHPIQVPNAVTPAQIDALFGAIIYSKGASVLRMLESYLNEQKADSFRLGLVAYLKKHAMGNAATADLWRALSQASGVDVAEMMPSWTLRPGYPVVRVRVETDGTMVFEQERFMLHEADPLVALAEYYHVPIHFAYLNGATLEETHIVLKEERASTPFMCKGRHCDDKLVIVNRDRRGFYRVAYPSEMVARIVTHVQSETSPVLTFADVAGTIDDLWHLAAANRDYQVDMRQLLDLSKATATRYHSSVVVSKALETLLAAGESVGGAAKDGAHRVVAALLQPIHSAISGTTHDGQLLDATLAIVAVRVNHPTMARKSAADFATFRSGGTLTPDLRLPAYRAAVSNVYFDDAAITDHFGWLLQRYESSGSTAADRTNALLVLCHTTSVPLLDRLLQVSLDESQVRAQDTPSLLNECANQDRERVWAFMEANYDKLNERYGKHLFTLANLMANVASRFRTQATHDRVAVFLKARGYDAARLEGILDSIKSHIQWNARYATSVTAWYASAQ